MTYRQGISFPMEPTEKDLKKLRREVAKNKFGVVDGGKREKGKSEGKKKE